MLFGVPAPPPVSYSRDVAPILALHCNGCHGDAGGLSTRRYADLMNGGNLGRVVISGDPEGSLLIHFIEGRRGETHRMPLGGRALSREQIGTIRRWIAEGATEDAAPPRRYTLTKPAVRLDRGQTLRVFVRVQTQSYLTLTVRDPVHSRVLLTEVASVKTPRERVDSGEPGELMSWDVKPGIGWPSSVDVELWIEYAVEEPRDVEFFVRLIDP